MLRVYYLDISCIPVRDNCHYFYYPTEVGSIESEPASCLRKQEFRVKVTFESGISQFFHHYSISAPLPICAPDLMGAKLP